MNIAPIAKRISEEHARPAHEVRLRAAPSPTGRAHIGNVRTYFMGYAYAKRFGGKFVFRIEDTDTKRSVPGGAEALIEAYSAFGIVADEDPFRGGKYGPYVQTQRKDIYQKYADELVKNGHAYYCFCSHDRLEEVRAQQKARKQKPMYDRHCRTIPPEEVQKRIAAGEPHVIRMKFPTEGTTVCHDLIFGAVTFQNKDVEDQVLIKADGLPTYHLAVVVDDHLMKITTAVRGTEWFPSFPKHVKLYEYFGWDMPEFAHVPVILNPDGKGKLSKRHGAMPAISYLRKGYVCDAVLNYTMLCGWAPEQEKAHVDEIYTFDELIELFDFRRCHKAGARYDQDKFDYINAAHIRRLSLDDFMKTVFDWAEQYVLKPFLTDQFDTPQDWEVELRQQVEHYLPLWRSDEQKFKGMLELLQERVVFLSQVPDMAGFLYNDHLKYSMDDFDQLHQNAYAEALARVWSVLKPVVAKAWAQASWESTIRSCADDLGWKHGDLFMLIRIAVTGRRVSPPLFESMRLMGVDRCDALIEDALKFIQSIHG